MYSVWLNGKPVEGVPCRHHHHTETLPLAAENLHKTLMQRICGNLFFFIETPHADTNTHLESLPLTVEDMGKTLILMMYHAFFEVSAKSLNCSVLKERNGLILFCRSLPPAQMTKGSATCWDSATSHCTATAPSKSGQNHKDSLCSACSRRDLAPVSCNPSHF